MTFRDLGIIEPILKALKEQGYENPTPIQEKSIPILLKGKDLLASAQTGTGKTASFSIPILQRMAVQKEGNKGQRKIKTLIVTPTRELAIQIGDNFRAYSKYVGIRNTVIFGGIKQGIQTQALHKGVDVLIATPGRLLDLMNQGFISLSDIEYFVLDEADRMLDMGFIHDIKKLLKVLPKKRQSLFFSATMPDAIMHLSRNILGNPEKVVIRPEQTTAEKVKQAIYHVSKKNKAPLLIHLLQEKCTDTTLIFSRTKHGADKIVRFLGKNNIKAAAIHGNKSQTARQRALNDFKNGDLRVLIATDIAARGIDIAELPMVINYDLPNIPETYVHRIGRTGRANASGDALSFCDQLEEPYLKDIQKLINQKINVVNDHPFPIDPNEIVEPAPKQGQQKKKDGQSQKSTNTPANNQRRKKNRKPSWKRNK